MTRIFISYSRKDENFARQLATALANLNADIWIDIEDIPAGMKWSRAIQEGLDTADALIVVISPESMASHNVEDEWQYFLDHDKPVIPILLRNAKIHFQLNRIQWIDFKNQAFDVAIIDLHEELGRNGIRLQAPARPQQEQTPLSHGHASVPEPELPTKPSQGNNQTMMIVGAVISLIVVIAIVAFVLMPDGNTDAQATINAQNTRLAAFEQATQSYQETSIAQVTQEASNTITPTATLTDVPTTSTPTASPTEAPILLGPVDDNSGWSPIEQTIDGVVMVLVPSGRFTLGTSQEHFDANYAVCNEFLGASSCDALRDEFNGSTITINDPYWIDKYEVSQATYGSRNSELPQVNVTAADAESHCATRSGRLPSEAEWEFAAKGPSEWRYPWGNEWDVSNVRANICDVNCSNNWAASNYNDGYPEASPVDELHGSASWVGAFNMVGNIWEWTSDRYRTDSTNTLRGGAWTWIQGEATTTSRSAGIAEQTGFYGFRCVRPYVEGDLDNFRP